MPHIDTVPLLEIAFPARIIEWRGPSPFYFVAVPARRCAAVARGARVASYGWGVIPVSATIGAMAGEVAFTTSLFPREGGYLLPVKAEVRRRAGVALGDRVAVTMRIDRTRAAMHA